jgi:polysaccharide biosynthesis transport protein
LRSLIISTLSPTAPHRAPKTILVTSSVAGEGKTTLSRSLGVLMAHQGWRVLVIDLYPQSSTAARHGAVPGGASISTRLKDGGSIADAVEHIAEIGIDVLDAPQLRSEALALLAGGKIPRMIEQLEEIYDIIIIDGPAALGSAEVKPLAAVADVVLFAVRWRGTSRDTATEALRGLDLAEGGQIMAVLTRVDLKHSASRILGGHTGGALEGRFRTMVAWRLFARWKRSPTPEHP